MTCTAYTHTNTRTRTHTHTHTCTEAHFSCQLHLPEHEARLNQGISHSYGLFISMTWRGFIHRLSWSIQPCRRTYTQTHTYACTCTHTHTYTQSCRDAACHTLTWKHLNKKTWMQTKETCTLVQFKVWDKATITVYYYLLHLSNYGIVPAHLPHTYIYTQKCAHCLNTWL